jgi:hypothetical protein
MASRLPLLFVGLASLLGAVGCNSSHISDAYLSLDQEGRRLSVCIRPTKIDNQTPNHFYAFVEMYAFKDDTLLTPVVRNSDSLELVKTDQLEPQDDELAEYGDIAPGKTGKQGTLISWEMLGPPVPGSTSGEHLPLPEGNFAYEFYLDDHSSPDSRVAFTISAQCP